MTCIWVLNESKTFERPNTEYDIRLLLFFKYFQLNIMNFSIFLTTLQSNYQFIIMDLHVNSVLTKGIQCSSCLLNVNSRWVHNTPVFQACDILLHRHCPRDRYLQISFESQAAWTCLLVNRCPLANSNRSYRSCSRNCCPHTCYSTRMHI